jgi:hypothetical protein
MEALQMLKFNLKVERLNFTRDWVTKEKEMADDVADEDLLGKLLEGDFQNGMDRAIRTISIDED